LGAKRGGWGRRTEEKKGLFSPSDKIPKQNIFGKLTAANRPEEEKKEENKNKGGEKRECNRRGTRERPKEGKKSGLRDLVGATSGKGFTNMPHEVHP